MSCDRFKHDLHAYFRQELAADRAAWIDAHAAACGDCGELMKLAREISCRDFVDTLNEYVEGDIDADRRAVFDRHLAICPDCTNYVDSYRKAMDMSMAAFLGRPVIPAEPPPDLLRAIFEAKKRRG